MPQDKGPVDYATLKLGKQIPVAPPYGKTQAGYDYSGGGDGETYFPSVQDTSARREQRDLLYSEDAEGDLVEPGPAHAKARRRARAHKRFLDLLAGEPY